MIIERLYNNNKFFCFNGASYNLLRKEKIRSTFLRILKDYNLENSVLRKTYVDCGASVGTETVRYVDLFDTIHCFEPTLEQFTVLNANVQNYDNVIAHNVALGNFSGTSEFTYYSYKGGQCSTLALTNDEDRASRFGDAKKVYHVPVRELDSYELKNVGYIKIDVEGFEYEVITGAAKTLAECSPILNVEITRNHNETINLLKNMDYHPIFFDHDSNLFEVKNDLQFTQYNDMIVWSSNDITLSGTKIEQMKTVGMNFPNKMNPVWGDFWFIKG